MSGFEKNPIQISEQTFIKRDGSTITVLAYDRLDPGGEWFDYVAVDITEQRAAEDELRYARAHLEDVVEERTRELREARDNASRANQAQVRVFVIHEP